MQLRLQSLLRISRPRFWLYTAGPFVIGYLAGVQNLAQLSSATFFILLLYFLLPANIFLYGINDLADGDTDQFNTKKKSYEQALQHSHQKPLKLALWICALLTVGLIVFSGSPALSSVLLLFLFLSFAYSQKPFRFKAHPFIDSASNFLYLLPGVYGYLQSSQEFPPLMIILACSFWTAAMHLFSAVPDISADKKAGLKTTAVTLGTVKSLILCSLLWLVSGIIVLTTTKMWWLGIIFVYPLIPLITLLKKLPLPRVYQIFPMLNAGLGFLLFWSIFLMKFQRL